MYTKPLFEEIAQGVYLLKAPFSTIWSGVYLIIGEQNILVDTGASAQGVDECILYALEQLGITPKDVDWLINTHAHGDHMGGNGRFLELSGHAKLAAYETCVDKMIDPLKYNIATRAVFPKYSPKPASSLPAYPCPDLVLKDGDMLGDRLQVFHAPGHDTECVIILDRPTMTLITGDSIQGFGTVGVDGAGVAFYKDVEAYRRTLKKAQELGCENLIAGHDFCPFGAIAKGKNEVEQYLNASAYALEIYDTMVRRMLADGITDLAEIARGVLKKLCVEEPPYLFMTMYTVNEHVKEISAE